MTTAGIDTHVRLLQTQQVGSETAGELFNDATEVGGWPAKLGLDTRHPIANIVIRSGWIVDGITVTYRLKDRTTKQVVHGTPSIEGDQPLNLKESEVILAISGRAGYHNYYKTDFVNQISFVILDEATASIRVAGPFGNGDKSNQGKVFRIAGPIYAFAGRAEKKDHLGLHSLSSFKDAASELIV